MPTATVNCKYTLCQRLHTETGNREQVTLMVDLIYRVSVTVDLCSSRMWHKSSVQTSNSPAPLGLIATERQVNNEHAECPEGRFSSQINQSISQSQELVREKQDGNKM